MRLDGFDEFGWNDPIFSANLATWLIFLTKIKKYILLIMTLFIGEECISDATEFKLLCLLTPVFKNV